jgi:hypothetical protein
MKAPAALAGDGMGICKGIYGPVQSYAFLDTVREVPVFITPDTVGYEVAYGNIAVPEG